MSTERDYKFYLLYFYSALFLGSTSTSLRIHAQTITSGVTAGLHQQEIALPRNNFDIFAVVPLANGSLKGVTSDRHFFLFGLSYTRLLTRTRICNIWWVSEIMPVELLAEPFINGSRIQTLANDPPFTESRITYGVGTNPVGTDVLFLRDRRWQPFVGVHAGFSYFTRNVLASDGAQFNFMVDGRAGLRYALHQNESLSLAFMFQHMSNAYMAAGNPGVDSYMIRIAYTFPFRFRHQR
jgi:hypothetical protein